MKTKMRMVFGLDGFPAMQATEQGVSMQETLFGVSFTDESREWEMFVTWMSMQNGEWGWSISLSRVDCRIRIASGAGTFTTIIDQVNAGIERVWSF